MELFDYIFYRTSRFYQKWDDDTFYFYGIGVVSILQLGYFISVLLLIAFLSDDFNYLIFERGEGKNFLTSGIILPVLIIYGCNLIRYLKFKRFEKLNEVYQSESLGKRQKRKYQIILIYIISIGITIGLSVYRRYYL